MIELIILIISAILTITMINAAFRLGNRVAVATETSAIHLAALYNTLSPEAKARADAELRRIIRDTKKRRVDTTSTF